MTKPDTVPPITKAITNLLNEHITLVGYDDVSANKNVLSNTVKK
jgi:hypothetical protein